VSILAWRGKSNVARAVTLEEEAEVEDRLRERRSLSSRLESAKNLMDQTTINLDALIASIKSGKT